MANSVIIEKNNVILFKRLIYTQCADCFSSTKETKKLKCPANGKERRIGSNKNGGVVYFCSEKDEHVNSGKKFKSQIDVYQDAAIDLNAALQSTRDKVTSRTRKMLHNIRSYNAHIQQEIFNIIPQEKLTSDYKKQLPLAKKLIESNIDKSASSVIRIIKNTYGISNEFSIFDHLLDAKNKEIKLERHPIRNVVLNILHAFFQDFTDKQVHVTVDDFNKSINIDYRSFTGALYHIIQNAEKYTHDKSEIFVRFQNIQNKASISFEMLSLAITDEDNDQLYNDGFSGTYAKKTQKNGDGLGMGIIRDLLALNNAQLIIHRDIGGKDSVKYYRDCEYVINKFEIVFESEFR